MSEVKIRESVERTDLVHDLLDKITSKKKNHLYIKV